MISRAVHMIFEEMAALRLKGWSYGVSVSHLEIYNENLRDLLAEAGAEPRKLEIKHVDGGRMAAVTNLEVVPVDSAEAVEVGACVTVLRCCCKLRTLHTFIHAYARAPHSPNRVALVCDLWRAAR